MAASVGAGDAPSPQEEALSAQAPAGRAALALALLAIGSSAMIHSWSPLAARLRSGAPVEGVFLVSDDVAHPARTDAVYARYDAGRGALDLVSLPGDAALADGRRRAGKAYAAALKEDGDPQRASAEAAGDLRAAVSEENGAVSFLHLSAADASAVTAAAGGADPAAVDDAALGADPALRRAADAARGLLSAPLGPWGAVRRLWNARGAGDLSRYDLAVLALESCGVSPLRVRPIEFPAWRHGEARRDLLRTLWSDPPRARPIQVEVLNGSPSPGAAAVVTKRLRAQGIDVVYFGNLGARLARTRLVDRSGDREALAELRRKAPARAPHTWTALAPEKLLHASVLLGSDAEVGR